LINEFDICKKSEMKTVYTVWFSVICICQLNAQTIFDIEIEVPEGYASTELVMPPSPLNTQILFIGGIDTVATNSTYGNNSGFALAKDWHDFIGFTPDESGESLGWVSVNHEKIQQDERLGDGGGMTVFKIASNNKGYIEVLEQRLADGRNGHFFNVDFVNTVGETGMNCGGINTTDGRVWTAEEWFRGCNTGCGNTAITDVDSLGNIVNGLRDTADFTIRNSSIDFADGITLPKYQNFNWMVEIDVKNAKAIRKQYNWGRQPFESGTILPDNKTVYFGADATPAFFTKFVAEKAGDFTKGKLFIYNEDSTHKWIAVENTMEAMTNLNVLAVKAGATMYNRFEWLTYSSQTGKVYFSETGRDLPYSRWSDEALKGLKPAEHHLKRAIQQGLKSAIDRSYYDYYGRILEFDPANDTFSVLLEGGPYINQLDSIQEVDYPSQHLSNPDGLTIATINEQDYLIIQEDLNGISFGRVPAGTLNRMCEVYLLDLSIKAPSIKDLTRLLIVPFGAEVTGARFLPDGNTLLINSQHPNGANPYPYNHSLTLAITGFDNFNITDLQEHDFTTDKTLKIYPNPTSRFVHFNKQIDVAVFDAAGKRIKVVRNAHKLSVAEFEPGVYYLQTNNMEIKKLILQ